MKNEPVKIRMIRKVANVYVLLFLNMNISLKHVNEKNIKLIKGIQKGCEICGCELVCGELVCGETAEMGDVYKTNGFDLAGFAVGTVSKNNILPKNIEEGDIILGIKSNGLHSNGYSLVRKILRYSEYDIDELLKPTRIYNEVLDIIEEHGDNIVGNVIQNNENIKKKFDRFYSRKDTYSLGVCNGCQLMVKLDILGGNIKMERNESGRFESRFPTVQVENSKCHFTKKLNEMKLGMWVAHGEGRFVIDNETLSELNENKQIVMRYVDFNGNKTQSYPHNPNGRHLALMPHPERTFLKWQLPWCPFDLRSDYTPWFNIFRLD